AVAGQGRLTILRRSNFYLKYLTFDTARDRTPQSPLPRNPFLSRAVRQAVSLAVDRPALVGRLTAYGIPATQPVPRFIFGFDPTLPVPDRDLARARDLLRQAGLPNGFPVVLHSRKLFEDAARVVKEQLADVGIAADVVILPDPGFWGLLNRFET